MGLSKKLIVSLYNLAKMIPDHFLIEALEYAGLSFPLTYPVEIMPKIGETNWALFQQYLKVGAYINQDGLCICGEEFYKPELHHAIVSKRNAMGFENPNIIHHPHNVIVLNPDCHQKIDRYRSGELLCSIYGLKKMKETIKQIGGIKYVHFLCGSF